MSRKLVSSLALLAVGTSATIALGHPAKNVGAISGHVTFTGTPPKMRPIDMAKEPSCSNSAQVSRKRFGKVKCSAPN